MKLRYGFVSNSSSSSFTCEISGETLEGWDGQYDQETATCVNGHSYLAEYLPDIPEPEIEPEPERTLEEKRELLAEWFEDDEDELGSKCKAEAMRKGCKELVEDAYAEYLKAVEEEAEAEEEFDYGEVPEKYCPLCNLSFITNRTMVRYLLMKFGLNAQKVGKEIRDNYERLSTLESRLDHEGV